MKLGEILKKQRAKMSTKEKLNMEKMEKMEKNPLSNLTEVVGMSMNYSIEEKKNIERRRKLNG